MSKSGLLARQKAHAIAKALDKSIEEVFFRTVK